MMILGQVVKSKKKVLIAGGAGFIGSHLSTTYLEYGWDICCIDNLQTGSKKNIENHLTSPHFSFIDHNIQGKQFLTNSFSFYTNKIK
jgi:UDP-glucuronate decarboxylase